MIASGMQFIVPSWSSQIQSLLFGQAATMTDVHVWLYVGLTAIIIGFILFWFRPLQLMLFDPDYAKTCGFPTVWIERAVFWLFIISMILGIRSVGVVLISGMSIASTIAARQFTNKLQILFVLSAFFGAISGLIGNIISIEGSIALSTSGARLTLPTGPTIILSGAIIALFSLLFSPQKGLLFRLWRIVAFRFRCLKENTLKSIWSKKASTFAELKKFHWISPLGQWIALWHLQKGGWVIRSPEGNYLLTTDGERKAASIVRLHRLWELYLASELGEVPNKVHLNAEEMEHILTPEVEEQLTLLLSNPTVDPHRQPIPSRNFI